MLKGTSGDPSIADTLAHQAIERVRSEGQMSDAFWPQTTPSRVRALALASLGILLVLFLIIGLAIGQARDGMRIIGTEAGPKVMATSDLYYALSDMDTQVANMLLMSGQGQEADAGAAMRAFEERRRAADEALMGAIQLVEGDDTQERNLRDILDGIGRYEQLVAEARLLSRMADSDEPTPDEVVDRYRTATWVMRYDLLPKAHNLTLRGGWEIEQTYDEKRTGALVGLTWVAAVGLLAVGVMGVLHHYMAVKFRRRVNIPIALATSGTLILTMMAATMLGVQAEHLRAAKEDGIDCVLDLARARSASTNMQGDQSRFLLDPRLRPNYEQLYLEEAQRVVHLNPDKGDVPGNVGSYTDELDTLVNTYTQYPGTLYGFLGERVGRDDLPGQDAAQERVIREYAAFHRADQEMRDLAAKGDAEEAVALRMREVEEAFIAYEAALTDLIGLHKDAFEEAVAVGEQGQGGWGVVLPVVALFIALLVVAGIYPRLAEYR
ncbi:hypothetical protein HNR23_004872 [Nocardiopsis mwathae]|uniref:Uncharacterized protein n=1 Tax=Nocardiopsis mwathae TaxID=1472723 RepID=A0A7X0D7N6_9ACTN|nr:hypothetical protein [Nocardiopsis mwathae]MBB6174812.1 hypothetical protein [Nocardiopsis mwathae]